MVFHYVDLFPTTADTSSWCVAHYPSVQTLPHLFLTEIALENQSDIVFSKSLRSPKDISKALRSPFRVDNKSSSNTYGLQDYPPPLTELDVHVRVEHTISVQQNDRPDTCAREEQWKPKSTWDSEA